MKPALLVIAGPNGGGKTTVTARLRDEHWSEGVEYLNPDEIARDRFVTTHWPPSQVCPVLSVHPTSFVGAGLQPTTSALAAMAEAQHNAPGLPPICMRPSLRSGP